MHISRFVMAVIIAAIYVILAIGFVRADRQPHSGGFINLQGMMSGIVTLPWTFLMEECVGRKINFRSNVEMGAAIAICGALLFGLCYGALSLADYIWNWMPARR